MPDILIRGMEMPGHCFNCSTKINPDERRCNIDGHIFEETLSKLTCRRDDDCPLHELPAHGDLIDRDAALSHPFANGHYDHENANKHFIGGHESYKEWLEDLPVIVPASEEANHENP